MPELPEVETIRRGLHDFILDHHITSVEVLTPKSFNGPVELVTGQKIINLRRRGKALLIDLANQITLLIHLRMTGQLIFRAHGTESGAKMEPVTKTDIPHPLLSQKTFAGGHPTDSFFTELPNRQTRVILHLNHGALFFNDQRKFGFIKVIPTAEVEQDSFISALAKEPWDISLDEFFAKLQRRRHSSIKSVILDQKVIAGIGNIYADEALFYAGIHPGRHAGSLTLAEAKQLIEGAKSSMTASIDSGGSTMATYLRADGTKGNYLEKFAQVFHREGQPCRRCGQEIIKIRVAGRGTHLCPNCQPQSNFTNHQPQSDLIESSR
ncbi:MAG: bifunctional DNA-formamidopyrimidine glycosylase/DNA-(apurinic or apyrimidinic site) lyase [Candidatus Saccharibacteria bacterium]|nr:bifunctional DNA-formamidopyrimidine glycosylase/DNA-(apurinic or apyrimidinic site) lyase [Candidatus Saccharibacteria bacterium]